MPDQKPNQYLKNLDVHFISLVDAGANKKTLVHKSAHSREAGPEEAGSATSFQKQVKIAKTDEEKRLVYCIVYSPEETDAHGDAMKAEEIEKAAHHFLFEGRVDQVDKQHDEDPDEGKIVESYIIGKNDENFPDDPAGSWAVVIKVLNDDTWAEVKKGDITGVSMQGVCNTEPVEGEDETTKSMFRKILDAVSGKKVSKDFKDRLMHRQIRQAVWAFEEEVFDQLNDEDVEDKKAAVLNTIQDFESYISDLSEETTKQFKKTDMSEKKKDKAEKSKETPEGNEPTEIEKALTKALDEKLNPLEEKLDDVTKRLEGVEKAAPGSKLEKGQENSEEEEEKERTSKGLSILG